MKGLGGIIVLVCVCGALACKQPPRDAAENNEIEQPGDMKVSVTRVSPVSPVSPVQVDSQTIELPKPVDKGVDPNKIESEVKVGPAVNYEKLRKLRTEKLAALEKQYAAYFAPDFKGNRIANGDFEAPWEKTARFPEGWGPLASLPNPGFLRAQKAFKDGVAAARMFGAVDGDATMKSTTAPPVEELRGKEVVFGAWVYTHTPSKVQVMVVDSWKKYNVAAPSLIGEWQLVIVSARIAEDSDNVQFAIQIKAAEPAAECLVDGVVLAVP